MNLKCFFFGHNEHPTNFETWENSGFNWICQDCGGKYKENTNLKIDRLKAIVEILKR